MLNGLRKWVRSLSHRGQFHTHRCRCGKEWRCGVPADECHTTDCAECEAAWTEQMAHFEEHMMAEIVKAFHRGATQRLH